MVYSHKEPKFVLTDYGKRAVNDYIAELATKRKEILDAGKDTAIDTEFPSEEDIVANVNSNDLD